MKSGLFHVFLRHTSASLLLTENADPDVRRDLENFISRLVPDGDPHYLHRAEGPDDMPAHIRSVLTSYRTEPARDGTANSRWEPGKVSTYGNTVAARTGVSSHDYRRGYSV